MCQYFLGTTLACYDRVLELSRELTLDTRHNTRLSVRTLMDRGVRSVALGN